MGLHLNYEGLNIACLATWPAWPLKIPSQSPNVTGPRAPPTASTSSCLTSQTQSAGAGMVGQTQPSAVKGLSSEELSHPSQSLAVPGREVQEVGMEGAVAPRLNPEKELRAAPSFIPRQSPRPPRGHTGQALGAGAEMRLCPSPAL